MPERHFALFSVFHPAFLNQIQRADLRHSSHLQRLQALLYFQSQETSVPNLSLSFSASGERKEEKRRNKNEPSLKIKMRYERLRWEIKGRWGRKWDLLL